MNIAFKQRLHYLELVVLLVKRELKVKYRGSVLGYLWSMLNPLLFMTIISIVFSLMMRGIENYNLFVLSGILFWNMVTLTLNMGTTAIVRNNSLLQKVKIPIWIFPVVPAGLGVTNFMLSLVPYIVVYAISGRALPEQWWLAPIVIGLALVFLAGVAITLSTLNVFFRDVSHVLEPLLTLLFYATPIIYDRRGSQVPERIQELLLWNPFTHFVEAFRASIFGDRVISGHDFIVLISCSVVTFSIGVVLYKTLKPRLIYHL